MHNAFQNIDLNTNLTNLISKWNILESETNRHTPLVYLVDHTKNNLIKEVLHNVIELHFWKTMNQSISEQTVPLNYSTLRCAKNNGWTASTQFLEDSCFLAVHLRDVLYVLHLILGYVVFLPYRYLFRLPNSMRLTTNASDILMQIARLSTIDLSQLPNALIVTGRNLGHLANRVSALYWCKTIYWCVQSSSQCLLFINGSHETLHSALKFVLF